MCIAERRGAGRPKSQRFCIRRNAPFSQAATDDKRVRRYPASAGVASGARGALGSLANDVLPAGVLWGYGSREELTAAGARTLYEEPVELGPIVL
jgi:hypothetical protein